MTSSNQREIPTTSSQTYHQELGPTAQAWVQTAREIGCIASTGAICSAVKRAGYGRYPPGYRPPLSEQKLARLELPLA